MEIRDLSKEDLRVIERGLEQYNEKYMPDSPAGRVQVGLYSVCMMKITNSWAVWMLK